jgi:hypothetical protein
MKRRSPCRGSKSPLKQAAIGSCEPEGSSPFCTQMAHQRDCNDFASHVILGLAFKKSVHDLTRPASFRSYLRELFDEPSRGFNQRPRPAM